MLQYIIIDNSTTATKTFSILFLFFFKYHTGYKVVSGGTDTHMFLLDVRDKGIDGAKLDIMLEQCSMSGMN